MKTYEIAGDTYMLYNILQMKADQLKSAIESFGKIAPKTKASRVESVWAEGFPLFCVAEGKIFLFDKNGKNPRESGRA
jgi:hypothetical protein